MQKKFDNLFELTSFLAGILANHTPVACYREATVRKEPDGYVLTHLTGPLTGNIYTTLVRLNSSPAEIRIAYETCWERGWECPHDCIVCTKEVEIDCITDFLHDVLKSGFEEVADS